MVLNTNDLPTANISERIATNLSEIIMYDTFYYT